MKQTPLERLLSLEEFDEKFPLAYSHEALLNSGCLSKRNIVLLKDWILHSYTKELLTLVRGEMLQNIETYHADEFCDAFDSIISKIEGK